MELVIALVRAFELRRVWVSDPVSGSVLAQAQALEWA